MFGLAGAKGSASRLLMLNVDDEWNMREKEEVVASGSPLVGIVDAG